jgi:hypothetical protein
MNLGWPPGVLQEITMILRQAIRHFGGFGKPKNLSRTVALSPNVATLRPPSLKIGIGLPAPPPK